ncbi:hypothetical protein BDU57DRAFT_511736 [Ampelomyces quisqualis]|uniref:Uncharacterized protein n=1 Tax=Ampelomyces quisqualis TaxID=50730 RepID=A0A6A5QU13_AMPQU|nr:hypothetical protein BDU57DRAFT_511736 [Ampelomyces quisqualis]
MTTPPPSQILSSRQIIPSVPKLPALRLDLAKLLHLPTSHALQPLFRKRRKQRHAIEATVPPALLKIQSKGEARLERLRRLERAVEICVVFAHFFDLAVHESVLCGNAGCGRMTHSRNLFAALPIS